MSDLYRPPAMPLYFDDLIADTTDLSNEELGAYLRLMHRQWTKGFVPDDLVAMAHIAHNISPLKMRSIRTRIGTRLRPHPDISDALITPRMEEVRAKGKAYSDSQATNGKRGAKSRWPRKTDGDPNGTAIAAPIPNDSFPISIYTDTNVSAKKTALDYGTWPADDPSLKALALIFLGAFGNCRDSVKAERHIPAYAGLLAQMRSRGVSIGVAWDACASALFHNGEKPLFGASIKTAMSYLPEKPRGVRASAFPSEIPRDGDDEYRRKLRMETG